MGGSFGRRGVTTKRGIFIFGECQTIPLFSFRRENAPRKRQPV